MQKFSLVLVVVAVMLFGCSNSEVRNVSIDELVHNTKEFIDKKIYVEGTVVHVCGVDQKKIKLRSESGKIVKVVPMDSTAVFDKSLNRKKVRFTGIVKEFRVSEEQIDQMEKDKKLLCHVDHNPCRDTEWVKNKQEKGVADSMSARDIAKLRKRMEESGKDYISVVTVCGENFEFVD